MAEATRNQTGSGSSGGGSNDGGGGGQLSGELGKLRSAVMGRIGSEATSRIGSLTDKLTEFSSGGGDDGGGGGGGGGAKKAAGAKAGEKLAQGESPVKAALSAGASGVKEKVSGLFGGGSKSGGGKGGKRLKVTNIIEEIDVGAPIDVVYNQWTQFQDWSGFMKKVENVEQKDDPELDFKAQVLWSHRSWQAQIKEQVPNERIVWRSKGEKGHVDGAVTFHELAPDLTRVLVVLEYYPQGLFERTGNLWRAQGRRVRLELKHFRRQVMSEALLHPDDVDGWRGEIHDGEVQVSDEDARQREQDSDESQDSEESDESDDSEESDDSDESEEESDESEESEESEGSDDESEDETEDDDRDTQRRRARSRDRRSDDDGRRSQRQGQREGGQREGRRRNDRPRQRGEREGQGRRRAGARER